MADVGLKDSVWKVFWGSLAILAFIFIFFTYNASGMITEVGVEAEDVFLPFAVVGWMYTPSSPVFGFTIFLSGIAVLCMLALQFYPGFQRQTLAVKIKSNNNNNQGGGYRRR
jgi:hypothetical protein